MRTCDDRTDLLLDYVYGLLEESEAQELRAHVAACPPCQAALADAEAQQTLLARAAQVYAHVPAFTAPAAEAPATPPAAPPAPATTPLASRLQPAEAGTPAEPTPEPAADPAAATLPLPPPARRRWAWVAAAAALLLVAGGAYTVVRYQDGLAELQTDLTAARKKVKEIDQEFVQERAKHQQAVAALPANFEGDFLGVRVVGPASYQRNAPSQYRVVARGPAGAPATAKVTAQLVDVPKVGEEKGNVLFKAELDVAGEALLRLPAGLPVRGAVPRLEVEARSGTAREKVEKLVVVSGPSYVTQLVTSKPAYRAGDILFFRSLTLDRFSLEPPAHEFRLGFTLLDAQGRVVRRLQAATKHGVAGGEFAVTSDLADGQYTLQVSATATQGEGFLPQTRRLAIVREEAPVLTLDRDAYRFGDTGNAQFRGRLLQNGQPVPNQPLTVKAEMGGKPVALLGAPAGKPLQMRTDQAGKAAFQFSVPPAPATAAPPGPEAQLKLQVQVHDGKLNEKLTQTIPVVPPSAAAPPALAPVAVEFFPEGGDLPAGMPTRVCVVARDAVGRPVALEGSVVDHSGREVARVKVPADRPGAGVFSLTPQAGESYSLKIVAPAGARATGAALAAQREGVVLTAAEAVGREGEPLRLTLRDARPGRELLVLALCRGRLVDQTVVTTGKDGTAVELKPVPGTRGVVRALVCEMRQGQLVPLAERLLYRAPAEYLLLSVAGKTGQPLRFPPASHVELQVKAKTEAGAATRAWLVAAVVDERVLPAPGHRAEQGAPAYFYLTREVRQPADLEDADFLLADTPQARQALDLFLWTHGGRRSAPVNSPAPTAVAGELWKKARAGVPAVLVAGDSLEALRARYEAEQGRHRAERERKRAALTEEARRREEALQREKDDRLERARWAALALSRHEDLPEMYLRQGVVISLLLLFSLGVLFLVAGAVRAFWWARSPRNSLAVALTALGACAGLYLGTASLRTADGGGERDPLAGLRTPAWPPLAQVAAGRDKGDLDARHGVRPGQGGGSPSGTTGVYTLASALKNREQAAGGEGGGRGSGGPGLKKEIVADAKQATRQADTDRDFLSEKKRDETAAHARRFAELRDAQLRALDGVGGYGGAAKQPGDVRHPYTPGVALPGVGAKGKAAPGKSADKGGKGSAEAEADTGVFFLRPYTYQQPRGAVTVQDTLLWHPALEAKDGTARLEFDLPSSVTTYRVLLYGHSPSGRLGVYEGKLRTKK